MPESLSRKRVLNPGGKWQKILRETLRPESPDVSPVMKTIPKTSGGPVHIALTVGLLAACAANLMLVCAWL
ncbi:MAG: hypothetical protein E7813_06120 [Bradyrhizobium sp.]|nr:MAG: hypothetical protein E7813_06120 [Bradyrhizobium sp.]